MKLPSVNENTTIKSSIKALYQISSMFLCITETVSKASEGEEDIVYANFNIKDGY